MPPMLSSIARRFTQRAKSDARIDRSGRVVTGVGSGAESQQAGVGSGSPSASSEGPRRILPSQSRVREDRRRGSASIFAGRTMQQNTAMGGVAGARVHALTPRDSPASPWSSSHAARRAWHWGCTQMRPPSDGRGCKTSMGEGKQRRGTPLLCFSLALLRPVRCCRSLAVTLRLSLSSRGGPRAKQSCVCEHRLLTSVAVAL